MLLLSINKLSATFIAYFFESEKLFLYKSLLSDGTNISQITYIIENVAVQYNIYLITVLRDIIFPRCRKFISCICKIRLEILDKMQKNSVQNNTNTYTGNAVINALYTRISEYLNRFQDFKTTISPENLIYRYTDIPIVD